MPEVGDIVTVILWRGASERQCREVRDWMAGNNSGSVLSDLRVEGGRDRWFVVADSKKRSRISWPH